MKYRDEDDKCYGVTGMAIGLTIYNADEYFDGIDIDGDGMDCIEFSSNYFFKGNPAISAKASWQHTLERFQVTLGLVIADALCRKMMHDHGVVDKKLRRQLLDICLEEGKESCQLEEDEAERIFNKSFNYLVRVFSANGMRELIRDFAGNLKAKRSFTRQEVAEMLHQLR